MLTMIQTLDRVGSPQRPPKAKMAGSQRFMCYCVAHLLVQPTNTTTTLTMAHRAALMESAIIVTQALPVFPSQHFSSLHFERHQIWDVQDSTLPCACTDCKDCKLVTVAGLHHVHRRAVLLT